MPPWISYNITSVNCSKLVNVQMQYISLLAEPLNRRYELCPVPAMVIKPKTRLSQRAGPGSQKLKTLARFFSCP